MIFLADHEKAELHDGSQQLSKDALAEESSSPALPLRRDLEHLLYSTSGHVLALNKIKPRFQHVMKKDLDYQKAGFAKLILFLESLTKSVMVGAMNVYLPQTTSVTSCTIPCHQLVHYAHLCFTLAPLVASCGRSRCGYPIC